MEKTGKLIVLLGLLLTAAGAMVWLLGDKLKWLGRLPGNIRIERPDIKVYIPFTTMLLVSVVLSVIMWVIRKAGG